MNEEIEMRDLRASAAEDFRRFDIEQQRNRKYQEFVEEEVRNS